MSSGSTADSPAAPSPGALSWLRNIVRAIITTPVFLGSHLIRNRGIGRSIEHVAEFSEPAPRPALSNDGGVQSALDGTGPAVMRAYSVHVVRPHMSGTQLIQRLIADPNAVNAWAVAGFVADDHPATQLAPGDRLVVELAGPWNGPVVVERADADALVLATLDGHMEAGRIRFDTTAASVAADGQTGDGFIFRVTSWARAGDRAFEFLHLRVPIGRELQTAMWVAMCRKAASAAGGEVGTITVRTEILDGGDDGDGGAER